MRAVQVVVVTGVVMTAVSARYSVDNALPSAVRAFAAETYEAPREAMPLDEPLDELLADLPAELDAELVPDEVTAGIDESQLKWIRANLDALEMFISAPIVTVMLSVAMSSPAILLHAIVGVALITFGTTGMRLVMLDASHSLPSFEDWARKVVDFSRSVVAIHTAGSGLKYFATSTLTHNELARAFALSLIGLLIPMLPIANHESLQRSVVELAIRTGKFGAILAILLFLASATIRLVSV